MKKIFITMILFFSSILVNCRKEEPIMKEGYYHGFTSEMIMFSSEMDFGYDHYWLIENNIAYYYHTDFLFYQAKIVKGQNAIYFVGYLADFHGVINGKEFIYIVTYFEKGNYFLIKE